MAGVRTALTSGSLIQLHDVALTATNAFAIRQGISRSERICMCRPALHLPATPLPVVS
jgi:hypothetical protein